MLELPARALAVSAVLVGACAVGPAYQRPDDVVPVPSTFGAAVDVPAVLSPDDAAGVADLAWWRLFGDTTLDTLVGEAVRDSPDIALAAARVEEAEALERVAASSLWPALSMDLSAGYRRFPQTAQFANIGRDTAIYSVSGVFSWELDLWGKIRRNREAAAAELVATGAARRGVVLSLVGKVAETYFALSAQEALLEVAISTAASREETLALVRQRELGSVSNRVEIANAEANLATAQAAIPLARAQVGTLENQLSALLGRAPGDVPRGTPLLAQGLPPSVPAGLPSSLLGRRPDVVEAAEGIHAATARVGSAEADYLPQVELDAVGGIANTDLRDLFSEDALFYQVGGSLKQPIYQGGRIAATRDAASARAKQATAQYRRVALNALREVSSALIVTARVREALDARAREVASTEEALALVEQRYGVGRSSYLDVLQVDRYLFEARNRLVETRLDVLRAYVALYLALGGGWSAAAGSSSP
jgi:outer membrane protein, multidrug efflux system